MAVTTWSVKASSPPTFMEQSDGGHVTSVGSHIEFIYQAILQSYDTKRETAVYKIGQYFTVSGNYADIYSDRVYLSNRLAARRYIGEFSKYNGRRNPGVYERGVWHEATLVSGTNYLVMEGQGGDVGTGDAEIRLVVPRFGHDPMVHGVDGIWTQGEISSGLRTWQSLYTDGAKGSTEGNKLATTTGFFYSDEDEQVERVASYANVPLSQNATIAEIARQSNNGTWESVHWTTMDQVGNYRIKCCTKDQAGNIACGYRNVTVKPKHYRVSFLDWDDTVLKSDLVKLNSCALPPANPSRTGYQFSGWDANYCAVAQDLIIHAQYIPNSYTIRYDGNGADHGLMHDSVHVYDVAKPLEPNGYSRDGWRFIAWNRAPDGSGTVYQDRQSIKNLTNKNNDLITLYAIWDQAPNLTAQERWFFEDETIDEDRLLEYVQATDREDGDITNQVVISENTIRPHVIGDYTVTYTVRDRMNQSTSATVPVHIVKRAHHLEGRSAYLRFIDASYLNTLKANSIWRNDAHHSLLNQTLFSPVPKEVWVLDEQAIAQIKEFNQTHDYSKESDEAFFNQFAHLRQ